MEEQNIADVLGAGGVAKGAPAPSPAPPVESPKSTNSLPDMIAQTEAAPTPSTAAVTHKPAARSPLPDPISFLKQFGTNKDFWLVFLGILSLLINLLAVNEAKTASQASEHTAELAAAEQFRPQISTFYTQCSELYSTIPGEPVRQALFLARNNPYPSPAPSPNVRSKSEVYATIRPPHTFSYCRLYNYGALPVVNVYLDYWTYYHKPGDHSEPDGPPPLNKAPRRQDVYTIWFPAVPANGSVQYELINTGPDIVYARNDLELYFQEVDSGGQLSKPFPQTEETFVTLQPYVPTSAKHK
jgi:hypothetical protein